MQKYRDSVLGSNGLPVESASVTVYQAGTTTKATIYSNNGVTQADNPLVTDTAGAFAFYAADGKYDLAISKTGFGTLTLTDVLLDDLDTAGTVSFTPVGSLTSTNVQAALAELDAEKSATTHNHDAAYAALGHNHDAAYAALAHNHDASYAALVHNHTGTYSGVGHDHAGVYSPVGHNHDGAYEPVISKALGYAKWNGTAWVFANETYSLSTHNHDAAYTPLAHAGAASGVHGLTGAVAGVSDAQTLTNKTINLANNTLAGTKAQFNAALTSDDFAMLSDFAGSLATSGYLTLPSGLMVQWWHQSLTTSATNYNFPVAFPNNCFVVFSGNSNYAAAIVAALVVSKTQYTAWSNSAAGYYFFAIGN